MSDIFLSYKSEDRPRAKIIAEALEQQGYSVWWDRKIPPGKTFEQVIVENLDATRCVIVLWSKKSVLSDWVKEEADKGKKRQILVPVLIDDVEIPMGFSRMQAAQLVGWQGTLPNPDFDLLLNSISEIVGRPPAQEVGKMKKQMDELNEDSKYQESEIPSKSTVIEYPESGLRPSIQNLRYELQKTGLRKEEVDDLLIGNNNHRSGIIASVVSKMPKSTKKMERLFPYDYANVFLSVVQSLKSSGREIVSLYDTPVGANVEARIPIGLLSNSMSLLFEIIDKGQSKVFVIGTSMMDQLIDPLGLGKKPLEEVFNAVERYNNGQQMQIEEEVMPRIKKFCTGCGRPNDRGLKFCSHCGTNLSVT